MDRINELVQKEMTRKEFLATVGFGLASLFGLAALLQLVTGKKALQNSSYGYGDSTYGGQKNI